MVVRQFAVKGREHVGAAAKDLVPQIAGLLSRSDLEVRCAGAEALSYIGSSLLQVFPPIYDLMLRSKRDTPINGFSLERVTAFKTFISKRYTAINGFSPHETLLSMDLGPNETLLSVDLAHTRHCYQWI